MLVDGVEMGVQFCKVLSEEAHVAVVNISIPPLGGGGGGGGGGGWVVVFNALSSTYSVTDYRSGGLGCEPQTRLTLRVLKITEENMLPLQWHLQMVRYSSLLG